MSVDKIEPHNKNTENFIVRGRCSQYVGNVLVVPMKNPGAKPISIPCASLDNPTRSIGKSGVPSSIVNGTVVVGQRFGDQQWTVVNVLSGNRSNDEGGHQITEASIPSAVYAAQYDSDGESPYLKSKKTKIPYDDGLAFGQIGSATVKDEEKKLFDSDKSQDPMGDAKPENPAKGYKREPMAGKKKNIPKSVGGEPSTAGSIKDPTAFIKKILGKQGEMIPNAFKMMENLKKAAKNGSPINAAAAVGGADLIRKALAGISNNQSQQQGTEDEEDFFCTLFKELFPDFECKINDVPTEIFRKWKREYIAALQEDGEPSV